MSRPSPFCYFKTSPEIIRLAVMMYVRFPLSLRDVEDLLHERGIDVSHETVRFWWNRFGQMFAAEIRRWRVDRMRAFSSWRWHVDELFVRISGERHYLWRAVDHEGEVLEAVVTKRRNKKAALKFLRKLMKRLGPPEETVTDRFPSYRAALRDRKRALGTRAPMTIPQRANQRWSLEPDLKVVERYHRVVIHRLCREDGGLHALGRYRSQAA